MEEELTKEQENKLYETFFLVDQDKDNCITTNELGLTLRALGIFLTENDISDLKSEIENKRGGKISYEQFKKLYKKKLKTNKTIEDLKNAFHFFDGNNSGKVNINDIKHGLMTLGDKMTEEEIKNIVEEICDKEGNIDYKKFLLKFSEN